jgi:hypothetical protein
MKVKVKKVDREANSSIENKHQDRVLANDMTQMLERMETMKMLKMRYFKIFVRKAVLTWRS